MKVVIEDAGPCRKILRVSAPAEVVRPVYEEVLGGYARVAKIDGFRPGRAPLNVTERFYSKAIAQETKDRLVPRLYRDALKQEGLTPVAIVSVGDVILNKDTGITFKVTVDVPPDFKLPKYHKIALKANPVEITDAQVEQDHLPASLRGRVYYRPTDRGLEAEIQKRLAAWRRRTP